jgi:hypothetical protein
MYRGVLYYKTGHIASEWGLSVNQQRVLLGGVPPSTYHKWKGGTVGTLSYDRGRYREPSPAQRSARPPRRPGKRAHAGLVGIGERQRRSPSSSPGLRNPASADLARSASENRSFPSRGPPSPDAPLGRESPQARGACGQPHAAAGSVSADYTGFLLLPDALAHSSPRQSARPAALLSLH